MSAPELRVSPERRGLFRKAAIVSLGESRSDDDTWIVPIEWFAATFAPLFPVFVGELRLQAARAGLRGSYVPPGATIGNALDRAFLGVAARCTARWFLRTMASVSLRGTALLIQIQAAYPPQIGWEARGLIVGSAGIAASYSGRQP